MAGHGLLTPRCLDVRWPQMLAEVAAAAYLLATVGAQAAPEIRADVQAMLDRPQYAEGDGWGSC